MLSKGPRVPKGSPTGRRIDWRRLPLAMAAASVALVTLGPATAHAAPGKPSQRRAVPRGTLVLRIGGLPRGERGVVTVAGPRQARRSRRRFRRTVSRQGVVRLRGLRPGRYGVRVRRVRMRRRHGTVRRGAVAFPTRRRLRVAVQPRDVGRVPVRYGTIRNPGLRRLRGGIARVFGKSASPRGLVVLGKQGRRYRRGTLLTAPPGGRFPRGLLARVTGVKQRGRRTIVKLRPASIYEVAPNMRFKTRLAVTPAADASALSCGNASIDPFLKVANVWANGGWTTSDVWFVGRVKTGAWMDLDFDVGAGVEVEAIGGVSCELSLPGFKVQGTAGPIPIFGAISPAISGSIGGGARMTAEGKVRIETGATVGVAPPSASPRLDVGSPEFKLEDEVFADVGLGFGIHSQVGVGVVDAANLYVAFDNDLDFSVGGGRCSWDLKLGTFTAGGKVGPLGIQTPSSPPLLEHNLWQDECGPPPLSTPLTRAEMSWSTDADVDLYAWDQDGNLAYFGETEGIAEAELVEDVIPEEGEDDHAPEVFLENDSPGRRLTFGVCLFRGEPTDVTLTVPSVPDPRGDDRAFEASLSGPGDGEVLATSPEGDGYTPPEGWCESNE